MNNETKTISREDLLKLLYPLQQAYEMVLVAYHSDNRNYYNERAKENLDKIFAILSQQAEANK